MEYIVTLITGLLELILFLPVVLSCYFAGWFTLSPLATFIVKIIPDDDNSHGFWGFLLWYLYVLRIGLAGFIGSFYSLFVIYFFTFIGLFTRYRTDIESLLQFLYFF